MPITENSVFSTRFHMVCPPDWRAKLQALAADGGTKESEIVRQLVEQAYQKRFGNRKAGEPTPARNSRAGIAAKAKGRK